MTHSLHLLSAAASAAVLTTITASCGSTKPATMTQAAFASVRPTPQIRATEAAAPRSVPYVWQNVAVVGGGFVPGIVFNAKKPGLLYARTDIGGAYRWDTAAKRWIPLTDGIGPDDWNLMGIESLATDPVDPNRVYLAAGTYMNEWAGDGAILRSTDQGRTWRRTDMPFKMGGNWPGRSMGERLAVDPDRDSVLFFGSRADGLWRSEDFGATWKKVETFPAVHGPEGIGIAFVTFDPTSAAMGEATRTIYVGVADPASPLYRSTDGGATWAAVPGQPTGFLPHHGVLAADGTLYVSYSNGPGPNDVTDGAVWKLNTRSGQWTDISPSKPGQNGAPKFGYAGLAVDAEHPQTVMVATLDRWSIGDGIYRTTDGGARWTPVDPTAERDSSAAPYLSWGSKRAALGHWIGTLAIDPFHPGHVLYGTGATIWGSDDADAQDGGKTTHWTVRAQGLEEIAANVLISPPAGAHLVSAMGDIGGFRHDDFAVSPAAGNFDDPRFTTTTGLDFAELSPAFMVRVGYGSNGHGAYSTDGGSTWKPFAAEPAGRHEAGTAAVAADASAIVWTPDRGVASYSRDRGASWTPCAGLPDGVKVVADRVDPRAFYAWDRQSGTVFTSADGGRTFSAGAAGLPSSDGVLRAAPGYAGDLWLALGGAGLWRSTDGGKSFARVASAGEARTAGFGKAAPGRAYPAVYLIGKVNGQAGVFRSVDSGASWVRINDDDHRYAVADIVIGDPRIFGRVYLGTNGRGILYGDPARR